MKRLSSFLGTRVIKTGVSVLLTSWICMLLDWPPIFAVFTAIVTLEPTVSDSIKKGMIRFPASAIGSFYAVLFISLLGASPITYALAAVFTIATCFKLKLHSGLLVATLASVAMIEVIHGSFIVAFFIRLGTTTVGLVVSTVVNMFVLPPDYTQEIIDRIVIARRQTGKIVTKVFNDILTGEHDDNTEDKRMIERLDKKLAGIDMLIRYQTEESKYHPLVGSEKEHFHDAVKHIQQLRLIHYHLDNLIHTPLQTPTWTEKENATIIEAVEALGSSMQNRSHYSRNEHIDQFNHLMELFWDDNEAVTQKKGDHPTHFTPELIILYELISIYRLVTRYYAKTDVPEEKDHST